MFARLPARPNRRARRIRGRVALAATVAAIASLGLIAAPDPSRAQRVATETPPPPPAAKKPAKATKSAGKEAAVAPGSGQAVMVVVLVNDEPITGYRGRAAPAPGDAGRARRAAQAAGAKLKSPNA